MSQPDWRPPHPQQRHPYSGSYGPPPRPQLPPASQQPPAGMWHYPPAIPQQQYWAPPPPPAPIPAPGPNIAAMLGLGFGLAGLLIFPILMGPAALVSGIVGLNVATHRGAMRASAHWAIALGIVNILLGLWAFNQL